MTPTQRSLSKFQASKLSRLQKAILQLAAENRTKGDRGSLGVDSMDCTTREILGQHPSKAQRAAVSRAIARLKARGLVEHRQFFCNRSGINLTPAGWETVIKIANGDFDNRFKEVLTP